MESIVVSARKLKKDLSVPRHHLCGTTSDVVRRIDKGSYPAHRLASENPIG